MPPYDYNDIRNDTWFARLQRQLGASSMKQIQATGSEADDPYFAARRAEAGTDLNNARLDAFRKERDYNMSAYAANNARMNAREAARQRTISAALARDWKPNQMLGTQAPDAVDGFSDAPATGITGEPGAPVALSAPTAYAAPMSGTHNAQRSAGTYMPYKAPAAPIVAPAAPRAASAGIYNPTAFYDKQVKEQRSRADAMIQKIAESLYRNDFYARYNPASSARDYYSKAVQIYSQTGGKI